MKFEACGHEAAVAEIKCPICGDLALDADYGVLSEDTHGYEPKNAKYVGREFMTSWPCGHTVVPEC